jgi:uncharacterized protein (TIGR03437 family)
MRFAGFTLALAGIFAGNALGQAPTVGGLVNNFSGIKPGLPNYGIAQGSIFSIYGTNLSSTTVGGSLPLQTTLGGVSVSVAVNGTTTNPLLYYVSSGQINAVLPSATPVGTGTITVTNSAGTSPAFPIQVVESAFGLLTTNYGSGPAQGYDASINASNQYIFFGSSEAANPGDVLELWGSGLGPVPGDATYVTVTPTAQVYIGGILATVQYAGRSGFTGLDQINVVVPSGVSGCYVSVAVVTGSYVSNFATLPVAAKGGRTCSDTVTPLSASILNGITQKGSYSVGFVDVSKSTTPGETIAGIPVGGGTTDSGSASFFKYTSINTEAYAGAYAFSSIGSCNLWSYTGAETAPLPFQYTSLNAGPDVNINGPGGLIAMPLQTEAGFSLYTTPSSDKSFIPATGGTFTFDNGSGGPDVGAFKATLQMASPLTWTNMNSISTVTRSAGVTVNWTGGDPSTYVSITGLSLGSVNGSTSNFVAALFTCEAPTPADTFTVSPAVLLSLPPSTTIGGVSLSSLSVSNFTNPVPFTATGLDAGFVEASVENSITVNYQ